MGKWQHAKAIIALPGVVTILVPLILIIFTPNLGIGWSLGFPGNLLVFIAGGTIIGVGLVFFIKTNLLFAEIGHGTLAPWDPPKKLVVKGLYRYVRNPMIVGVLFILLGEAVLFGSLFILLEFGIFLTINHIYFVKIEEQDLAEKFGEDYLLYKEHVPRWIPRLKPWDGLSDLNTP